MTRRIPGETDDDFKARRCLALAVAFRDRAILLDNGGWPRVADAMRAQARTAERAAGLIRFRSAEPPASLH
jgi:hypothetical protein